MTGMTTPIIARRLFMACVLLLAGTSALAQQVSVSRDHGVPGTSVIVTGSGFSNDDTSVRVTYNTDHDFIAEGPCPVVGGSFSCSFIVPEVPTESACQNNCGGGGITSTLRATGNTGGNNFWTPTEYTDSATTNFDVAEGISLRPSSGPPGTLVTVWGTGFSSSDTFNEVKFGGQTVAQGDVLGNFNGIGTGCLTWGYLAGGSVSANGACTFTVPDVAGGTDYPVTMTGYLGPLESESYFTTFYVIDPYQKTIQDAPSCAELQGAWEAGTSTCTLHSVATIGVRAMLTIPPGVTVIVSGDLAGLVNQGAIDNRGTLLITNSGVVRNIGNIVNGGTIDNRGSFYNTGTFLTTAMDQTQSGSFINRGSVTNSGLFASEGNNFGTVTVMVNSNTCLGDGLSATDPRRGMVSSEAPYVVFGNWNAGVCTVGLFSGGPEYFTVPQGTLWQVPAGTTLKNQGMLDVFGEIDNAGSLMNEALSLDGQYLPNSGFLAVYNKVVNNGTLTNQNGGSLGIGGTLDNNGALHNLPSGGIFVSGTLNNIGLINNGGGLYNYAIVNNSGTILNSGVISTRLTVFSEIVNTGEGSIVNQDGGTTNGVGGTITGTLGPTRIDLTAATCASFSGTWISLSNTCVLGLGTELTIDVATILTVGAGVTLQSFGLVTVGGQIDDYGTIINQGGFVIGINGRITTGAVVVKSGAAFANYDYLVIDALLLNGGSFTNAATGDILNRGTLTNTGTLTDCRFTDCGSTFPLAPTVVALSSTPNPSAIGQTVTLTAIVSPDQSSGTVTFYDGETSLGSAQIVFGSGRAALTTGAIGSGTRSITAQYNGDVSHAPAASAPLVQIVSANASAPIAVAVADFDGDGGADLAVAQFGSDTVAILPGNGDGTFRAAGFYAVGRNPIFIAAGDFNADGQADLAVVNHGAASVSVLLGHTDETFRSAMHYAAPFGAYPRSLAIADLNRDGKADLVVGSSGYASVLLGSGDGTFQSALQVTHADAIDAGSIATGDFDGDGDVDLVITTWIGNTVNVLRGNGDGTFAAPVVYRDNGFLGLRTVAVADTNGDGHSDLIVASAFTNNFTGTNLSVLLGNGDGSFQAARNFASAAGLESLLATDLNGDGVIDIAVASPNGALSTANVWLGKGDGSFHAAIAYPVGTNPSAIAAGDFNGDGRPDLVTTNPDSNDLTVLVGLFPVLPLLTVTANDATIVYGQPLPDFSASYFGFVNGDTAASLDGTLSFTTSATHTSDAGTYPVMPGGIASTDYSITFTAGALTIARASQAISFAPLGNRSFGDAPFTVVATGGASGNDVTFVATGICGVVADLVTITNVGECTVTASQESSANYLAAADVSRSFIVVDTTPPSFSGMPADQSHEAAGAAGAAVIYSPPTAADALDGDRPVTCSPASGSTFPLGPTMVACTAADASANTATATFTVTVIDTTAPSVTAADPTAEATSSAGAVVTYSASANDIVDGSLTPTCAPASGSIFALGTTIVSCSAIDARGNSASVTAMVTVQDTIAPVVTYTGNAGSYTADQAVDIQCAATDSGSGVASTTCANITGPAYHFAVGMNTYSANATDVVGNAGQASTSFTIVVSSRSVQNLVISFSTNQGLTSGLTAKLAAAANAANANARRGQLNAFENQVRAQTGKALTAAQAAILLQLGQSLY